MSSIDLFLSSTCIIGIVYPAMSLPSGGDPATHDMAKTFIQVPFADNRRVKALGARWDPEARSMFVPDGLDLAPFAHWMPSGAPPDAPEKAPDFFPKSAQSQAGYGPALEMQAVVEPPADATEVGTATRKAISLSRLLQGVAAAVANAFQDGIWTIVDVISVSTRGGHVYLELAERDSKAVVLAKASGMIWANTAKALVPQFERSTGARLAGGIKLLVRARPVFKPQFGFSLEIDAIDSDYTLGDLEARKREIRERLIQEGLFDKQKALPAPWDFSSVVVVAPDSAAGLGDFQAESQRLQRHGVCEFIYVHSRFQGEGAASEIAGVMRTALKAYKAERGCWPDAVAIIRGGGAANDLAWLNDYELASLICKVPAPVFTGIGHERDSTILDEICHTRFDTPSKVIAGIEQAIVRRCHEASDFFKAITHTASVSLEKSRLAVTRLDADNRANAQRQVDLARTRTREQFKVAVDSAQDAIRIARERSDKGLDFVLERGMSHVLRVRVQVDSAFEQMTMAARRVVDEAKGRVKGLIREVLVQGPRKTLVRGFAIARAADGRPVTRSDQIEIGQSYSLEFFDGSVRSKVLERIANDGDSRTGASGGLLP